MDQSSCWQSQNGGLSIAAGRAFDVSNGPGLKPFRSARFHGLGGSLFRDDEAEADAEVKGVPEVPLGDLAIGLQPLIDRWACPS